MKAYIGLVAVALVALPGTVAAQQAPRSITFDEAVGIALRQSTAIARSDNQQTLSALSVTDAKMRFLPNVSLSTSGSQDLQSRGTIGATHSMNARVSAGVTVFDGFANVATLKSAQLNDQAVSFDAERTRQEVVFSVISGYLGLIEAREQVVVAQENLAAQAKRERDVTVMVDRQSRPIADLYQQRATVASAKATLVNAERTRQLAEVTLIQSLRLDPAAEYAFVAPSLGAARIEDVDVATLVQQALQQRPDLAALATKVDAAEQGVRAARGDRLPTVSLSTGYSANYSSGSTLGFTDQLDASRGGSLSLSVSLPIFDGNAASRAVERANVQVDNARLTLDDQRQQVALEVRRAVLDRAASAAQLEAAQARVDAAQLARDAMEARYQAGVATLFEVSQAQATLVDASSALVRAKYSLHFQDRVLDYYTGTLDAAI